jgi:hypothetical protein
MNDFKPTWQQQQQMREAAEELRKLQQQIVMAGTYTLSSEPRASVYVAIDEYPSGKGFKVTGRFHGEDAALWYAHAFPDSEYKSGDYVYKTHQATCAISGRETICWRFKIAIETIEHTLWRTPKVSANWSFDRVAYKGRTGRIIGSTGGHPFAWHNSVTIRFDDGGKEVVNACNIYPGYDMPRLWERTPRQIDSKSRLSIWGWLTKKLSWINAETEINTHVRVSLGDWVPVAAPEFVDTLIDAGFETTQIRFYDYLLDEKVECPALYSSGANIVLVGDDVFTFLDALIVHKEPVLNE